MDIVLLTQSATADCTIIDPGTGLPTDIVITIYGQDSTQYRSGLMAYRRGSAKGEDEIQLNDEFMVAVTQSWAGVELDGKKLPFNAENALFVYSSCRAIRNQVDKFVWNSENFMPPRSTD